MDYKKHFKIKEIKEYMDQYEDVPDMYKTNTHLIYSSPATLSYNSPGAEGFGVKRAGLSIPGSVMLIVSPGCCGRNTSEISEIPGYKNRFFYLNISETDLITGKHLKKIPEALMEVYDFLDIKPSIFMICTTCVDALLGSDMERISRKAEEILPIPVRPCYMYALKREGTKPPMIQLRESLYSVLEKRKRNNSSINILGFFSHLDDDSEIYEILRSIGIKNTREISRCEDISEFMKMSEANFNILLNNEAEAAAKMLYDTHGIPFIELKRLYDIESIENQYKAFLNALSLKADYKIGKDKALKALEDFRKSYGDISISIGECLKANPFELAYALVKAGFKVKEIFANPDIMSYPYIRAVSEMSPSIKVYSNTEPSMLFYDDEKENVDLSIGKDAGYYHKEAVNLPWNQDIEPFGYKAAEKLYLSLKEVMDERS